MKNISNFKFLILCFALNTVFSLKFHRFIDDGTEVQKDSKCDFNTSRSFLNERNKNDTGFSNKKIFKNMTRFAMILERKYNALLYKTFQFGNIRLWIGNKTTNLYNQKQCEKNVLDQKTLMDNCSDMTGVDQFSEKNSDTTYKHQFYDQKINFTKNKYAIVEFQAEGSFPFYYFEASEDYQTMENFRVKFAVRYNETQKILKNKFLYFFDFCFKKNQDILKGNGNTKKKNGSYPMHKTKNNSQLFTNFTKNKTYNKEKSSEGQFKITATNKTLYLNLTIGKNNTINYLNTTKFEYVTTMYTNNTYKKLNQTKANNSESKFKKFDIIFIFAFIWGIFTNL